MSRVGRVAALGAVIAAVVLVGLVLFGGGSSYTVTARFVNAGQLVKGNPVQTGGAAIGSVSDIKITPNGQADIKMSIKKKYAPLPQGTRAAIKQFSLSGLANRYIDLSYPANRDGPIKTGGVINTDRTTTAVDLDELFNTLDPPTRRALQKTLQGSARQFAGAGDAANETFRYLNPALSTSSRLFREVTRDQPTLERFLINSSRLVTTLADRRDQLASLVGNLNTTTRALGDQKTALAESVQRLPPFMRRANTTFVNLRAALNDVDPLVDAAKPAATQLRPFLAQARGLASDAKPTVRDLRVTIKRKGARNDAIDLLNSVPPLENVAIDTAQRNGKQRPGAFPATAAGLKSAAPIVAEMRPYTTDFLGFLDDFSTTGGGFDSFGTYARANVSLNQAIYGPVKRGQFRRCPGSAEEAASDGSNVTSPALAQLLECDPSQRATGNAP